MIVQKDFLKRLKDFNLNSYESKLWISLLSRGVSTAGELSDISSVPRSRAYDVLESLEKKGFIMVKIGKPIKYLAVPPHEVVERVKKKIQEEAAARDQVLTKLKDSSLLEELSSLHNKGIELIDPTDRSGSFRGRDKVYDHLVSMIKRAKESVTLMTTHEGIERKSDVLKNHLKRASKKGVEIKIVVPKQTNKKILENFTDFAEIKPKGENAARFCVVDNSEILLFLTGDQKTHESYDSAIWVEAPHFVNYFNSLFAKEWSS